MKYLNNKNGDFMTVWHTSHNQMASGLNGLYFYSMSTSAPPFRIEINAEVG